MYKKICKHCNEYFFTSIKNKQYCSKECLINHQAFKREIKKNHRLDPGTGQICWRCANACGDCSWSREGKPVDGWKAKRTIIRSKGECDIYSYNIIYCPQFNQDVEVKVHR